MIGRFELSFVGERMLDGPAYLVLPDSKVGEMLVPFLKLRQRLGFSTARRSRIIYVPAAEMYPTDALPVVRASDWSTARDLTESGSGGSERLPEVVTRYFELPEAEIRAFDEVMEEFKGRIRLYEPAPLSLSKAFRPGDGGVLRGETGRSDKDSSLYLFEQWDLTLNFFTGEPTGLDSAFEVLWAELERIERYATPVDAEEHYDITPQEFAELFRRRDSRRI